MVGSSISMLAAGRRAENGGGKLNKTRSALDEKTQTRSADAVRPAPAAPVDEVAAEVDQRGFMIDPSQWSPGVALYLARRQGIRGWPGDLVSDHWRVIHYMRTYYEATGNAPSLRYTCHELNLTKRQFSRLFPGGLMTARRISGLPARRRSAGAQELPLAQQVLTGNWWERLTSGPFQDVGAADAEAEN